MVLLVTIECESYVIMKNYKLDQNIVLNAVGREIAIHFWKPVFCNMLVLAPKKIGIMNVTISDTSSSYTVTCPEDTSRRYCRILDASDNSYDGCSQTFQITWSTARFRCRILYWGDMDETETVINVIVESKLQLCKHATLREGEIKTFLLGFYRCCREYAGCDLVDRGEWRTCGAELPLSFVGQSLSSVICG